MASQADVRETGNDMFPAHLLTDNKSLLAALPEGYTMRPLSVTDYGNGFPEIFSVLTQVGDISKEAFEKRFREMQSIWGYYILVVLDGSKKIVGTGALVLEKKLYSSSSSLLDTHSVLMRTVSGAWRLQVISRILQSRRINRARSSDCTSSRP